MSLEHREELKAFLTDIWGEDDAFVFLAVKREKGKFEVPNARNWPQDSDLMVNWALSQSAKGNDVYYSMAHYSEPFSKAKEYVLGARTLWVDLDGNAADALASLPVLGLPAPTYRVATGREGHEHWYWLLGREAGVQPLEELNQRIAYALNGDSGCWNADRVLRVPFTSNHMIGKEDKLKPGQVPPFPVDFIEKNSVMENVEAFKKLPKVKEQLAEKLRLGDIPDVQDVIAMYKWDAKHLDIFKAENPELVTDRDNHYMAVAYWSAEVGMTDEEIYSVVQDLDTRLKKFLTRPDRDRRLTEMVSKARAKYPYTGEKQVQVQIQEDMKQLYTLKELLNADFKIEWLIEGLIPLNTINFLSAASGAGKSRLSLDLGLSAARGSTFLKWDITRPLKVLYVSLEMEGTMLKHFSESLMKGDELTALDDNFILAPVGAAIDLTTEAGENLIREFIESTDAELVFLDTMGALTFEEMGETQAKGINNALKRMIKDYGTTFFVIHHNKKPQESNKRPTMSDVYGSQYVLTEAATAFTMYQEESPKDIEFIPIKTRAGEAPEVVHMDGTKGFRFVLKKGYMNPESQQESEPAPPQQGRFNGIR